MQPEMRGSFEPQGEKRGVKSEIGIHAENGVRSREAARRAHAQFMPFRAALADHSAPVFWGRAGSSGGGLGFVA